MITLLAILTAWCAVAVTATGVLIACFVARNQQSRDGRSRSAGNHAVQSQVGGAQYGGGRR